MIPSHVCPTGHVVEPSDVRRSMLTPSNVGASQDRTQQDAQREHNRVSPTAAVVSPTDSVLLSVATLSGSVPEETVSPAVTGTEEETATSGTRN